MTSVGGCAVSVLQREPGGPDLFGERVPDLFRALAAEEFGHDLRRGRWGDERGFVEHADAFEADQDSAGGRFACGGVGVVALAGDGREDGQRAGALADLAVAAVLGGDGLPGAVAGDASLRALGDEQQHVAGGVGVEAAAHLEHRQPLVAGRERAQPIEQQFVGLRGAFVAQVDRSRASRRDLGRQRLEASGGRGRGGAVPGSRGGRADARVGGCRG